MKDLKNWLGRVLRDTERKRKNMVHAENLGIMVVFGRRGDYTFPEMENFLL